MVSTDGAFASAVTFLVGSQVSDHLQQLFANFNPQSGDLRGEDGRPPTRTGQGQEAMNTSSASVTACCAGAQCGRRTQALGLLASYPAFGAGPMIALVDEAPTAVIPDRIEGRVPRG